MTNGHYSATDYCQSETYLSEQYCCPNEGGSCVLSIYCPGGCYGGICVEPVTTTTTIITGVTTTTTLDLCLNKCGDGYCDGSCDETGITCYEDCGACGNSICEPVESVAICCKDCGCPDSYCDNDISVTYVCNSNICEQKSDQCSVNKLRFF